MRLPVGLAPALWPPLVGSPIPLNLSFNSFCFFFEDFNKEFPPNAPKLHVCPIWRVISFCPALCARQTLRFKFLTVKRWVGGNRIFFCFERCQKKNGQNWGAKTGRKRALGDVPPFALKSNQHRVVMGQCQRLASVMTFGPALAFALALLISGLLLLAYQKRTNREGCRCMILPPMSIEPSCPVNKGRP